MLLSAYFRKKPSFFAGLNGSARLGNEGLLGSGAKGVGDEEIFGGFD